MSVIVPTSEQLSKSRLCPLAVGVHANSFTYICRLRQICAGVDCCSLVFAFTPFGTPV